jgi:ferredoxin-NADP reductase
VVRLIYSDELQTLGATVHLTREPTAGYRRGRIGRSDVANLLEQAMSADDTVDPLVFVCGPTDFVEHIATLLLDAGGQPGAMRLERFG